MCLKSNVSMREDNVLCSHFYVVQCSRLAPRTQTRQHVPSMINATRKVLSIACTADMIFSRSRVGQFKADNWVVMTGDEVVIESTSVHKATRAMAKHPKRCLLLQVGHEDEPWNMVTPLVLASPVPPDPPARRPLFLRSWTREGNEHY